jgi:hypothetical protein
MNKFERAYVDPKDVAKLCKELLAKWQAKDPIVRDAIPATTEAEAAKQIIDYAENEVTGSQIRKNDVYQVAIRECGPKAMHLSIKRIDRQPIHDWRDMQEIKNQLVGSECEAIELYPAESRRVDTANQYHLWAINDYRFRFPFGFNGRFVTEDTLGESVNRPFV